MGERGTCIHRFDLLKSQLQNKQQALQFSIGLGKKEIQQITNMLLLCFLWILHDTIYK